MHMDLVLWSVSHPGSLDTVAFESARSEPPRPSINFLATNERSHPWLQAVTECQEGSNVNW